MGFKEEPVGKDGQQIGNVQHRTHHQDPDHNLLTGIGSANHQKPFAPRPAQRWQANDTQRADQEGDEGDRHGAAKAGHLGYVGLVGRDVDAANIGKTVGEKLLNLAGKKFKKR